MRFLPPLLIAAFGISHLAASDWNRPDYPGGEFEWFGVHEPSLWVGEVPDGVGATANFATGGYEEHLKLAVSGRDITLSRLEWRDSGTASSALILTGSGDSRLVLQSASGDRPSVIAYNTRITLAIDLSGTDGIDFNVPLDGDREVRGTILISGVNNDYQGGSWIGGLAEAADAKRTSTVIAARGSRLGSGDVHILNDGVVQVNWEGGMAPDAALTIDKGGKLILAFQGGTLRVKTLELAGERVPAGLYVAADPAVTEFIEGEGAIEVRE